ncbi:AAA family ATPase [Curtobacterium sp. GD1]|uniref:AAA family ATPase n=1 Tax=Curtobacterium sp. GD1 TaxID=2810612 RepID=UPI001E503340|nr:ATP-binding protein [Curtobacterium sp. GD1]MCC8906411.1 ATP-binding protein [Curtobacterium sp. GD1]
MTARDLRDLISAYGERDDLKFRRAAQAIIANEERKRHTVLATELRHLLAAGGSEVSVREIPRMPEPPTDRDSALPLARVSHPDVQLDDLTLAPAVRETFTGLVQEVRRWPELDRMNVPRRNRVLLAGPPGCGKTSAAAALAGALGRPLVTARVEGLISSFIGETATNLANLFEYVSNGSYVFFLDEFDSIGKLRDDPTDHGELRRVVNALLQMIDGYRGGSLIVAATNHAEVLDAALWRRFDVISELGLPTVGQIETMLRHELPLGFSAFDVAGIAARLSGLPHAAVQFLLDSAKRRAILAHRKKVNIDDVSLALTETVGRRWS